MTKEEKTICKMYLDDLDSTHDCNEYKLLMGLLEQNTVSEETYTQEYFARKKAEQKLWELQQNISEDCVSRQAVIKELNCEISGSIESDIDLSKHNREFQEFADMILNAQVKTIQALPTTAPTHGTCKDCKHWKDSDGVYRRGIGAESKCPINNSRVLEGTFYCADYEK